MNKYYEILDKILALGKMQSNKKGNIKYLLNEQLSLTPADLLDIFEGHNIARKKLKSELQLFMQGERCVEKYHEVLFLGATDVESNQAPCLSLVQFQIDEKELVLSAYQRSSDANLGLPADIYHLYLMARQIDLPLKSVTLNLGNVHIYENNIEKSRNLLNGDENVRFDLNTL